VKSDSKLNEIFSVIKSGIIGALVLNGICIILFFIGFAVRGSFVSYLYSRTLAKCPLEGLFIAISGIGFIIGLVMKRRFPRIQRGIAPLAGVAIPLVIGAWLLHAYAIRVSVPHTMKLSDCTNSTVSIHLEVPKGHAYHLELNTPEVQAKPDGTVSSTYKFSGHIRISSGASLIADLPIGSDKAWLTASGFVLTGAGLQNTAVPAVGQFIQPQKNYDIQITLNPPPPPLTSVWLYWLQSRIDMER
jgi:hypothetical protein